MTRTQEPRGKALLYDGGTGGEMTRFKAADPKQALAYPLLHTTKSFKWWLGQPLPASGPSGAPVNVMEAARASRFLQVHSVQCSAPACRKKRRPGWNQISRRWFFHWKLPQPRQQSTAACSHPRSPTSRSSHTNQAACAIVCGCQSHMHPPLPTRRPVFASFCGVRCHEQPKRIASRPRLMPFLLLRGVG